MWDLPGFIQFSNRKLHVRFWSLPKSLTLDDLEWQLWQLTPMSSRDLCWLICDHICLDPPTPVSFSLLIERDILQRAHCWSFWIHSCRQQGSHSSDRSWPVCSVDTVDHEILLQCLQTEFGVEWMPLTWLWSYLNGWTQYVKIGQHQSTAIQLEVVSHRVQYWDPSY